MQGRGSLFVAIGGQVICIRKQDGKELWRTRLKRFSGSTTLLVEKDAIFAAARGELFALNPKTGSINWNVPLGLGGNVCILGSQSEAAVAAAVQAAQAAMASAAAVAAMGGAAAAASS